MRRSIAVRLVVLTAGVALLAAAVIPAAPAPPAVRAVTETHFGVTVSDPYRYFEDPKDPGLAAYFKAQSSYTRAVLDAIPGRAALAARIAQLDNAAETIGDVQPVGGTYFYEKRPAGANTTRIYTRSISGGPERLVFDPDRFARSANEHYSIDYYSVSQAGRYLAAGVSEGGSEKTVMHVVDVRTGKLLPDVIDRAIYNARRGAPTSVRSTTSARRRRGPTSRRARRTRRASRACTCSAATPTAIRRSSATRSTRTSRSLPRTPRS
jgi:prolyl oligopeptidase